MSYFSSIARSASALVFALAPLPGAVAYATQADGPQAAGGSFQTSASVPARPEMPESLRRMLEAAGHSGDQGRIDAVVAVAKETYPEHGPEIDRIVGRITEEEEAKRLRQLAEMRFFENWRGSGEIGGSAATGNSDTVTLVVGLNLTREAIKWRHNFAALADLQRSEGQNSQERYAVSYQADWNLSKRAYIFGRFGWERNQVSGLRSRFTEALGLGYKVIATDPVVWELEAGPSLRQSDFYDRKEEVAAARIASNFGWQISPSTRFTQSTMAMFDASSNSIIATTALTGRVIGPVSARLSFNLQYESDPPELLKKLDTVTRMTLVYEFGGS